MAWWDEWQPSLEVAARENPFLATRPYDGLTDLFPDTTYGGMWTETDWSEYLPTYASRSGINQGLDLYDITHPNPYANPAAPGMGPGGSWTSAPGGDEWALVNQWDATIQQATQRSGVPANLIRAVMFLESGGVNLAPNGAGARGPMQVVPGYHSDLGIDWADPHQNIIGGAMILRQNYSTCGTWQGAVNAYYAGGCVPTGARDRPDQGGSGMTDSSYVGQIWNTYLQLEANNYRGTLPPGGNLDPGMTPATSYGTNSAPPPAGSNFWTITGGAPAPITQGHGMTDFAQGHVGPGGMYDYTSHYSRDGSHVGHAGVDVGLAVGTPLYTPIAGTVVCAGTGVSNGEDGCSAYTSEVCSAQQCGRFQVKGANGDMLIFGHMSSVALRPGQVIAAGAYVGNSGTANGGHVHVEYRRWVGAGVTQSGYESLDPRGVLSGPMGSVNLVPGTQVIPGGTHPYDFHSLIRAVQGGANPFATQGYLPSGPSWLHNRIAGTSYGGVGTAPGGTYYPLVGES